MRILVRAFAIYSMVIAFTFVVVGIVQRRIPEILLNALLPMIGSSVFAD
jgi:hypothetical protein